MRSIITASQREQLKGKLLSNEPLAKHTTWRIGGKADWVFFPADLDDLSKFLSFLPADEPLLWLGWGSNVLIRDGGFRGTIIITQPGLNRIKLTDDNLIYAETGVSINQVIQFGLQHDLGGIDFLAGIPGTIGGALTMNAGAFGGQTWDWVEKVITIDRFGKQFKRPKSEFTINYRHVNHPQKTHEWFVAAYLKLLPVDRIAAEKNINEIMMRRKAKQPLEYPNAGSVFKNPPNNYAASLIEKSGLKGLRVGGASVSTKHANFIVNDQNASAKDVEQLIAKVINEVEQQQGIKLETEVLIFGEL